MQPTVSAVGGVVNEGKAPKGRQKRAPKDQVKPYVADLVPSCNMNLMLPQPLVHTSARVLEFESLRDLLRGYASSPLGQARIAQLAPSRDSGWIKNQQELTSEVREFRRVGGRFDFSCLVDFGQRVEYSRISGA
jgi:hypothetical protein